MSQGMLLNPEIKRFAIFSPLFFKPPRPGTAPGDVAAETKVPESAGELLRAYTGSKYPGTAENCKAYFSNLERCFENNKATSKDISQTCQHYIQGIKRSECSQ